jgi:hypothetical protein
MTQLFNQDKFEQFQQAYEEAIIKQETQFTFNNQEYLVTYAKYLLDYLSTHYE